jgi:hypothetical protein
MKQGTPEDWEERGEAGGGSRLCWRRQEATNPLLVGGGGRRLCSGHSGRVKGWFSACVLMESWAKSGYQRWACIAMASRGKISVFFFFVRPFIFSVSFKLPDDGEFFLSYLDSYI